MLAALIALHAAVAVLAAAAGRLGRAVFGLAALPSAATLVYALSQAPRVLDGEAVEETIRWVPAIDLELGLRLDAFSLVMILLVSGIGVLIFSYAARYFDADRSDLGRYAGLLCAFSGSMLGVVTVDHLIALYVFWELTSITSYLLIGLNHTSAEARGAALQALLVTSLGGLVMLAGIILLGQSAGTFSIGEMAASPPGSGPLVVAAGLCLLMGMATKSAQVPFHFWLPGAMTAPTPVSAYLHSATMVKAGVYLAARLSPILVLATPGWRTVTVTLGAATMLLGGWRALRQHDLKLLLAYGTVSQLGFMMVLMGAGTEAALHAGAALLLAHGLFKATLFMVVGILDHSYGTRDLRRLSGVGRELPWLAAIATIAAASMAGVPLLFGFVSKEAALTALLDTSALGSYAPLWLAAVVIGSILTFAYSGRFVLGAFGSKKLSSAQRAAGQEPPHLHHRPGGAFVAPAALLAVLTVLLGLLPGLAGPLVDSATVALDANAEPHGLALWHGLGTPLYLSLLILALGGLVVLWRGRVESLQERLPAVPSAAGAYDGAVRLLNRSARWSTAIVQNGSLPIYLAVILTVAVVVPTAALVGDRSPWLPARLADSPLQVVAVGVAIAAAVAAAVARRRFAAVLAMGGVGYAVVTLFALHGAPDLALTQLLVETLGLVVFALALRHLPPRFAAHHWHVTQAVRGLVAGSVGVFVAGFALIAGRARIAAPSVSEDFIAHTEEAGGHNIVNIVLVDFRGFDTLGEITVLAVAALGFAALLLARRRNAHAGDESAADPVGAETAGGAQ